MRLFPRAHRARFGRVSDVMVDKVGSSGLIGGTVLGLIGALMAIPVAAGLKVVLAEQLHARDSADADAEAGGPSADPGERDMRHPPA